MLENEYRPDSIYSVNEYLSKQTVIVSRIQGLWDSGLPRIPFPRFIHVIIKETNISIVIRQTEITKVHSKRLDLKSWVLVQYPIL